MTTVAIIGATGYSALEVMKILHRHPHAEITTVTSRQEGKPHIAAVHPSLAGRLDLTCDNPSAESIAARAEFAFCCLPHGVSASFVPRLLGAGCKVVDLSADYRLDDPDEYEQWYGVKHPDAARLPETVYGLPELFREEIRTARLIANPGCYPTSAILALAPLLNKKLINPSTIIIDSKSGVSGGGRQPKLVFHYPECNESVSAYNVGRHRHTPEIELILGKAAGTKANIIFTPHLIPMDRGILSTTYSDPAEGTTAPSEDSLLATLREFYRDHPFVRVVDHLPATKDTVDSNFCDVTIRVVRGKILTISCLDNLIKGASGAAVQNFNLMTGVPETTAL